MTYKLQVIADYPYTHHIPIWANVREYLKKLPNTGCTYNDKLITLLNEYGAQDVPGTCFLEFPNEEFALMFKLKFS